MTQAMTVADQQAEQEMRALLASNPNALNALGLEFLDETDLRIYPSRMKIAHEDDPTIGQNGVKVGEFYNAKTNEVYGNAIEFTHLHFARKTRAEYKEPYEKDAPLLCGSDDGKAPRESTERRPLTNAKQGPCANCDSAQWENADGTRRTRPPCSEQHNFMLNVKTGDGTWDKVLLTLQKARASSAAILRELCLGAQNRRLIFATTKFVKGDRGNYYVPVFTYGDRLTPAEVMDTLLMAKGAYEAYKAGDIFIGADEGDDGNGSGSTAPTAAETKMPWDDDPDVGPVVKQATGAQEPAF